MINEWTVFKLLKNDYIAGFYILKPIIDDKIELDMLFVLPEFIGKEIGKQLMNHSF